MWMSKRARGSISVLLCMILLPMVTYSTMIIDATRLQAVRSNIAGAGELALNAIMSDYNVLLEEMYGLFANCNDEAELQDALKAYFQQTVEGRFLPEQGLDDQYVQRFLNGAVDTMFDADGNAIEQEITDFLRVQLDDTFLAGPVQGSALANPNTMKRQIIEYMKYRGPVSVASTILGKLDYFNNASTQVDACDKKVKYTEKLGDLQDPCLEAYEAIESEYNMGALMINEMLGEGFVNNNSKVDGMDEIIKDSKKQYEYATAFYLMNAQSPFYNGGNSYTFDSLGNDAFKEARDAGKIDAKYVNGDSLNYHFDYEPGPEIENPTRSDRIQSYLNTLDQILTLAKNNCDYDAGGKKISTFDTIQAHITDNTQRWYDEHGGLNRYSATDDPGLGRPENKWYCATITASKTAEQYPNYSKIETDTSSLFQPYLNLPDSKADEAKFETQLKKTKEVFAGQKLLDEKIKPEIANFAFTKEQFCQLKERFNNIWDELANLLREEFDETYAPKWAQYLVDKATYDGLWTDYNTKHEKYVKWEEDVARQEAGEDVDPGDEPENPKPPTMKEPTVPSKDNIWNEVCNKYSRLNYLEEQREALNQIANSMSLYSGRVDEYIKKASKNNQKYFLDYAQAYNESGYSGIAGVFMTLKTMKHGLSTASGKLQDILNLINGEDGLKSRQDSWKTTINGVNSDSTKSAMLSDYETMIDKFDENEVIALKKLIDDKLIPQISGLMSDINKIKYIGQSMCGITTTTSEFQKWAEEKLGEKVHNKFLNIARSPILQKANAALWKKFGLHEEIPVLPEYSTDQTIKSYKGGTDHQTEVAPDNVYDMAKQLVKEQYDAKVMYEDDACTNLKEIKRYQVLDGINDEYGCAYTPEDQKAYQVDKLKEADKNKEEGAPSALDPDEAFMITLYTEAQAAQNAQGETASQENTEVDNIDDAASDPMNNTTTAPAETSSTTTTQTTATEKFDEIMSNIETYCAQNVGNEPEQAPEMGKSTIDKKKPGKSSGGQSLSKAKELLQKFGDLTTQVVNNVYLEEYFTEMFTCRTDNQMLNSLTKDPDKKQLPVIMLNGYGNEASKAKKQLNVNTAWYGKEIEYLLWGNSDLDKNLAYTDAMIFAIRFALNAIYAFTAPDIQSYALELATAIAGWTVVGVPIVQVCITILIALAESGYDIYLLHDGRDVPIYKNQMTFVCSPTGMLKQVAKEGLKQITETAINKAANLVQEELNSAIDEVADAAAGKVDEKLDKYASKFENVVVEFGNKQVDAITSGIQQQFVTPILNQIVPVGSLIQLGEMYDTADPKALVRDAVHKALDKVQEHVGTDESNGDQAGVILVICRKILNEKRAEIEDLATENITAYFDSIKKPEIPDLNLEEKLNEMLKGFMNEYKSTINAEVEKAKKYVSDQIADAKNVAVDSAKSFVNEKMEEATAVLTGKVNDVTDEVLASIPEGKAIDTDASSGVTLNYKEYCKIFMLIFVTANQDKTLQRAGVLITANMRHPNPETAQKQDKFDITKANTLFSVNAQLDMTTLFPWPIVDMQDETSPETGIQLDLSHIQSSAVKINYCGVNGY